MKDFFKAIFSILAGTGRFITGIRNLIVNIIFFGIIGLLIYGFYGQRHSRLGTADRAEAAARAD